MIRLVSSTTRWSYRHVLKPMLFRCSPDAVHGWTIKLNKTRQRFFAAHRVVAICFAYKNPTVLGQDIDGIHFSNPVGLSAGFDKNIELVPTLQSLGFGFMTGGSVTYEPCAGNAKPWFYRLPSTKSLVVYAGLANDGAAQAKQNIRSFKPALLNSFPLVVSVAKTNNPGTCEDTEAIADYVGSLQMLRSEAAIRAFEINISCPNTYGGEPFTTPDRLDTLLVAIDKLKLDKPIWIKMPIDLPWQQFETLLKVILQHHVSTVTIGNLQKDRAAYPLADALPTSIQGNLSGMPTQKASNELIANTYQAYGDKLTIIGVGGIFTAEDAYEKICLGASLVELITGMIFEGPQLVGEINRELVALLQRDGFTHISQAVGSRQLQQN